MLRYRLRTRLLMVLVVAMGLVFSVAPAGADKPASAGNGKHKHSKSAKHKNKDKKSKSHSSSSKAEHGKHFAKRDRDSVHEHFDREFREGKDCPPGLAKKNNGCLPPGQAKKQWHQGEPLPQAVVYHDLPRKLLLELPPLPHGQRYVRVLRAVLLIDEGTRMVIDAIEDLRTL